MGIRTAARGWSRVQPTALLASLAVAFVAAGCSSSGPQQPAPYRTEQQLSTVASASADTMDWKNMHAASVEDLIVGRFAGVEVIHLANGASAIQIRGVNTIMGNTEPLYVIDGTEVEAGPGGGLWGLNPEDIARIEVLKDAGATALYGIRGANGVILITTKRAQYR